MTTTTDTIYTVQFVYQDSVVMVPVTVPATIDLQNDVDVAQIVETATDLAVDCLQGPAQEIWVESPDGDTIEY